MSNLERVIWIVIVLCLLVFLTGCGAGQDIPPEGPRVVCGQVGPDGKHVEVPCAV